MLMDRFWAASFLRQEAWSDIFVFWGGGRGVRSNALMTKNGVGDLFDLRLGGEDPC